MVCISVCVRVCVCVLIHMRGVGMDRYGGVSLSECLSKCAFVSTRALSIHIYCVNTIAFFNFTRPREFNSPRLENALGSERVFKCTYPSNTTPHPLVCLHVWQPKAEICVVTIS